jgi:hypothetical protein
MNISDRVRPQIGELAALVKQLNSTALKNLAERYPEFSKELEKGLDLGTEEEGWDYYNVKAKLALELAEIAQEGIGANVHVVIKRYSAVQNSRTVLAIVSALFGGATLTALGIGDIEQSQISAVATAITTICNAGLDAFAKNYSAARVKQSIDIEHAAWTLRAYCRELALLLEHQRPIAELKEAINKCNSFAFELNANKRKSILLA